MARIWVWFGPAIREAATAYGVPCELIVATIATEAGATSIDAVTTARREESGYLSEEETPHKVSIGPMQTLISTARGALKRPDLTGADLLDPRCNILAGTAYIAMQSKLTQCNPPLVAAAYNSGGLYTENVEANRWRLRCYPMGTGQHIDRFCLWFNDAMRLPDTIAQAGDAPSFVRSFKSV